ncbi:MAG: ECF transporter S component [Bacilli bacterium]|jgi:uncharacterized membrane protein|nr:ECF transporter S component [Bacilli bacterium]
MQNSTVRKMTLIALLAAVTYLATAFLRVPYAGNQGYLNFGDAIILFAACFIDPIAGGIVGIIGAGLADFTFGYIQFLPFTIVIKFVMGLVAGFFYRYGKGFFRYIGIVISSLFMVIGYAFAYYLLYGGWGAVVAYSPFDIVQAVAAIIMSLILIFTAKKVRLMRESDN